MWKNDKQAKKSKKQEGSQGGRQLQRQQQQQQLQKKAIKNKKGEIWDEKALDALFNKTVQYSVVNSYVFIIIKLYIWQ